MTTIRNWLQRFTNETGEEVTHMCLSDDWTTGPDAVSYPINEALPVEAFQNVLDIEFGGGWGGPITPSLCAWSSSYVVFSVCHDGAEWLSWVPSMPINHTPLRVGRW